MDLLDKLMERAEAGMNFDKMKPQSYTTDDLRKIFYTGVMSGMTLVMEEITANSTIDVGDRRNSCFRNCTDYTKRIVDMVTKKPN